MIDKRFTTPDDNGRVYIDADGNPHTFVYDEYEFHPSNVWDHYNTVFIFHYPCWDGLFAAEAYHTAYGDDTLFLAANYNAAKDHEQIRGDIELCRGKEVVVADFSFNLETTQRLIDMSTSFVCYDHHNGVDDAVKELIQFENKMCGFAQVMSELGLTSEWTPIIDAMDRYDFTDERHKEMILTHRQGLDEHRMEFMSFPLHPEAVYESGLVIAEYNDRQREHHMHNAEILSIDGRRVPVVECTVYALVSQMLHNMAVIWDGVAVAYHWSRRENAYKYSVRSTDDSAGEFARSFGGNGHDNAAGFLTKEHLRDTYAPVK